MSIYLCDRRYSLPLSFIAMAVFIVCVWITGGASRSDTWGQVFARAISWIYLAGIAIFGPPPTVWRGKVVFYFLIAAVLLTLCQVAPLPPSLWDQLPGREAFGPAADGGHPAPWRPLAIVPSAAINSAYSLIVPVVTYALMARLPRSKDGQLAALLLGIACATMVVGLIQLAGFPLISPFVNSKGDGVAAGTFANRNHFALFLAFGCLLAPAWAFHDRHYMNWRVFAALAMAPLFLLTILASGSRAGFAVGAIAFFGGLAISWPNVRTALHKYPRWVLPVLVACFVLLTSLLVLLSINEDRASSIIRVMAVNFEQDMRQRALPTVLAMISEYFPFGSGFGGFDTLFRMHEPDSLLKPTYFNRVHNDFLEVVLDGGAPGAILLFSGIVWWLWASVRAWTSKAADMLPKLGSLIILLIAIASLFDYPARTPIVMAFLIIAGVWLSRPLSERHGETLPPPHRHL